MGFCSLGVAHGLTDGGVVVEIVTEERSGLTSLAAAEGDEGSTGFDRYVEFAIYSHLEKPGSCPVVGSLSPGDSHCPRKEEVGRTG